MSLLQLVCSVFLDSLSPLADYEVVNLDASILSFICTVCIACSLGEIASIYPTAGGRSNVPDLVGHDTLTCGTQDNTIGWPLFAQRLRDPLPLG